MNRNKEEILNNGHKEGLPPVSRINKPIIEIPTDKRPNSILTNSNDFDLKPRDLVNNDGDSYPEVHPKITKPKPSIDLKNFRVVKNIGFENLPNQIYRRSLFNGFELNVMVVGCSGLGKSTFVNSLFLTNLYDESFPPTNKRSKQTTEINSTSALLKENDVQLRLTLIDTPGFGESVDNRECWKPIIDYIEARYNEHMMVQSRVDRVTGETKNHDCRVHVCLYFLEPTGHQLKPLDLEFLRNIHTKVNVVPIIAKADCLMPDEVAQFKATIKQQLRQEAIQIYDFSEEAAIVSLGSCSVNNKNRENSLKDILAKRQRMPFAVVSSNVTVDKNGTKVRGRAYPWGVVEVDNMEHNDFSALRTLLLSSHLQDILDTTDRLHYEHYRGSKMSHIAMDSQFGTLQDGRDPMIQMDDERKQFEQRIRKMEQDMQALFDSKVVEKTKKYDEKVEQIEKSEQEWAIELETEIKDMETRRNQFETERLAWEEINRNSILSASIDNLNDGKGKKSKSKWLHK